MAIETPDHYRTLGVDPDATGEEIRRAYRTLIRRHHPDVAGPSSAGVAADLSVAYQVLSDGDRRRAYDSDLSSPDQDVDAAEDGFTDTWGEEGSWGADPVEDSVVADAVIDDLGDEPVPPPPAPPSRRPRWVFWRRAVTTAAVDPAGARTWPWSGPYPPPEFVYPGVRRRQVVVLGVPLLLLAGVPAAVTAEQDPLGAVLVLIVLGAFVGVLLGMRSNKGRRWMSRPRVMRAVAVVIGVLLVLGIFTEQSPSSRAVALTGVAFWIGLVWMQLVKAQRRLDGVVPIASLKVHNMFGRLPGGVAADALDRDLAVFYDLPAMRMVRIEQPGHPFSHLLIVGARAAFVRAVRAPGGRYRWSGPSLLLEQSGTYPQEVMTGPFAQVIRDVGVRLGEGVQLRSWLVVYPTAGDPAGVTGWNDPGMPTVVGSQDGIRQLGEYLVAGGDVVDQQVVATALGALYR